MLYSVSTLLLDRGVRGAHTLQSGGLRPPEWWFASPDSLAGIHSLSSSSLWLASSKLRLKASSWLGAT